MGVVPRDERVRTVDEVLSSRSQLNQKRVVVRGYYHRAYEASQIQRAKELLSDGPNWITLPERGDFAAVAPHCTDRDVVVYGTLRVVEPMGAVNSYLMVEAIRAR